MACLTLIGDFVDIYPKKELYTEMWFFCDTRNLSCYRTAWIQQLFSEHFNILTQFATDCLIFSLIHNVDLQLKLFSHRLSAVSKQNQMRSKIPDGIGKDEKRVLMAKKCVQEHISIMR